MKTFSPAVIVLMASVLFGCSTTTGPGEEYTVEVSSIEVPDHVFEGDTLTVRILGRVGPNLCYELDRVVSTLQRPTHQRPGRLELKFVGTFSGGPNIGCPAAVADLDWETLVLPPFGGSSFEISVQQPSGEALEVAVPVLAGG